MPVHSSSRTVSTISGPHLPCTAARRWRQAFLCAPFRRRHRRFDFVSGRFRVVGRRLATRFSRRTLRGGGALDPRGARLRRAELEHRRCVDVARVVGRRLQTVHEAVRQRVRSMPCVQRREQNFERFLRLIYYCFVFYLLMKF